MDKQPNRGFGAVFAGVFALLGLFRLYSYTQTAMLADVLSGIGLLALAAGSFMTGSLVGTPRGERLSGKAAVGRYLSIAGITLVVVAMLTRLMR